MSNKTDKKWQEWSDATSGLIDSLCESVDEQVKSAEKTWATEGETALRFTAKSVRARIKIAWYFTKRAAEVLAKGQTKIKFLSVGTRRWKV